MHCGDYTVGCVLGAKLCAKHNCCGAAVLFFLDANAEDAGHPEVNLNNLRTAGNGRLQLVHKCLTDPV